MSRTKVKTTYSVMGDFGSTETAELYCIHNHSNDFTTFHHEDGSYVSMVFQEWKSGDDLWDAVQRLWRPFKGEWGKELKDGVEYFGKNPWENDT